MTSLSDEQQFKYLANGQIVRVLAQPAPDQIVVEIGHTYEDDDSEVFFDGTKVVRTVYDKPPVDAISRDILTLEERKNALSQSIAALADAERSAKKRVDALKQYAQLERVDDFLAGKITHYVTWNGCVNDVPVPRVSSLESERSGDSDRPWEALKLLVLYGSKDRTLEWKLSYYSDGSGYSARHCIPCCSHQEAVEKAKEILATSFAKYQRPESGNVSLAESLVAAARALDAPIPDGFEDWLRQHQARGFEEEIRRCEQKRQEWQQRLDAHLKTGATA